jgi:hypothetical protein
MWRLYVGYDDTGDAALVELRNDRFYAWLESQGFKRVGKDDDEFEVPETNKSRVEAKMHALCAQHNAPFAISWAKAEERSLYFVKLTATADVSAYVSVPADSEQEAQAKALEIAEGGNVTWAYQGVHDDITLDSCEKEKT